MHFLPGLLRTADDKPLRRVFSAMRSYGIGVAQGSLYNPAAVQDLLFFSKA